MAETQKWPYRGFLFVSIPLSLLEIGLLYLLFGQENLTILLAENGPVENMEAFFLFITALLALAAYLKSDEPLFAAVAFGICVFSVIFLTKEIPTCGSVFNVSNEGVCILHDIKRGIRISATVALAAYAIYVYVRHRQIILLLFHPRFCWPGFPFAICLLGGQIAEIYHLVWLEETLEMNAFAMMLVVSWQLVGRRSHR